MEHEVRIRLFGNDAIQVFCVCQFGPRKLRPLKRAVPLGEFNVEEASEKWDQAFMAHLIRWGQPSAAPRMYE